MLDSHIFQPLTFNWTSGESNFLIILVNQTSNKFANFLVANRFVHVYLDRPNTRKWSNDD